MTKAELLKKLESVADDEEVTFEEPQPADPSPVQKEEPAPPTPADKPIQMTVSDLMRLIEAEREKTAKILSEKEKEKPGVQEGDDNAEIFIL